MFLHIAGPHFIFFVYFLTYCVSRKKLCTTYFVCIKCSELFFVNGKRRFLDVLFVCIYFKGDTCREGKIFSSLLIRVILFSECDIILGTEHIVSDDH